MTNPNNKKRIIHNKPKSVIFFITFVHKHFPTYNNLKYIQITFKLNKKCMR